MPAEQFAVEGQPVRIVRIVGRQETVPGGLPRLNDLPQVAVVEFLVADKRDFADLGQFAFTDLEDQVDTVLGKLDHLGHDGRRETPASPVYVHNPLKIGLHPGTGKHDTGPQLYLVVQNFVRNPLVSLERDPVDDRVFNHPHDNVGPVLAYINVCKQARRKERLERLVEPRRRNLIARAQSHVRPHCIRFDPLSAFHPDFAQTIVKSLRLRCMRESRSQHCYCEQRCEQPVERAADAF